jgi:glyoxylase-like metal-dependent hydrolase (beta-lactamase superfamily II)
MQTAALSRRQFSALGLGAIAGLSLGRLSLARPDQAPAAAPPAAGRKQFFDWKVIGRTARVAFGQGGNALAVAKEGQAVLIDCKNSGIGATLRREAASVGWPIMLVINTHHHADHVGGNAAFRRDMKIIAHKNAIERCTAQAERLVKGAETLAQALEAGKGAGENGDQAPPEQAVAEAREFAKSIASL